VEFGTLSACLTRTNGRSTTTTLTVDCFALGACLAQPGLRANDVPDAHLAALAVEHGLRLATSDSGFARFSGLQWFNPSQAA
jgi:predicted nucleic acid-binding protein